MRTQTSGPPIKVMELHSPKTGADYLETHAHTVATCIHTVLAITTTTMTTTMTTTIGATDQTIAS